MGHFQTFHYLQSYLNNIAGEGQPKPNENFSKKVCEKNVFHAIFSTFFVFAENQTFEKQRSPAIAPFWWIEAEFLFDWLLECRSTTYNAINAFRKVQTRL